MENTDKQKCPLWLRLLKGISIILAVLCLIIVMFGWWLFGTGSGAKWLVSTALPYAQNNLPDNLQLDIENIEANTLADIRIGQLTLSDNEGVWLEIDTLFLRWEPMKLAAATLSVQEISARKLHYLRAPTGEEAPKKPLFEQLEAAQDSLRDLPDMLADIPLPPVNIDKLSIDELILDSGLVDIPSRFQLSGEVDFVDTNTLNLAINSLEGVETQAKIALSIVDNLPILNVAWNEASGGMLGNMLMLVTPAPVRATVNAEVASDRLHHEIMIEADNITLLQGNFALPESPDAPIALTANLPQPVLISPLSQFTQPIELNVTLLEQLLSATAKTQQITLNPEQSLKQVAIDAKLAFAKDPHIAIDTNATATFHQAEADPTPLDITLQATGNDGKWQLQSLNATANNMQANAQGSLDTDKGAAEMQGNATLPQLEASFNAQGNELFTSPRAKLTLMVNKLHYPLPAPLDKVIVTPLKLTANTTPTEKKLPDVELMIESKNLNGEALLHPNASNTETQVDASFKVDGLPAPLTLKAQHSAAGIGHILATSTAITAESNYALKETEIALTNLLIDSGRDMQIKGDMVYDKTTSLATGSIKGFIKSTKPLQNLGIKTPDIRASKGMLAINIEQQKSIQTAGLSFESGALTLDKAPIANNVTLKANAKLPADKPVLLDAEAKATSLSSPVALDRLTLTAKGDMSALDWKATAKHDADNTSLKTQGTISLTEAVTLGINTLNASWRKNTLALRNPATITYGSKEISVDNIDLSLNDSARITMQSTLKNDTVAGTLHIEDLPLESIPIAAMQGMQGNLSSDLTLSGSANSPVAEMTVNIDNLQQNYPQQTKLRDQPLAVKITANLRKQELTAQLSANAPDAESFAAANVTMPVTVSLAPDTLHFAPKGTMEAALNADMILAPFLPLLLPDGMYGAGHMIADITANGELTNPTLQGKIDLHSGRIEVLQSGSVVEQLTFNAIADGRKITLTQGSATDGDKGTLEFSGNIELTSLLPMNLQASIKQFTAARHPMVNATLSGDMSLKGDMSDALLKSDMNIDRAQIVIKPSNAADVTEIEVVEVDSLDAPLASEQEVDALNEEDKAEDKAKAKKQAPFAQNLKLDVSVDAQNQIFLDGFGLNAELKGAVDISGTASAPKLGGKMETVRGRWEFFGRTFTIVRGEASLSENNLSAPLINIRAEADADDVVAVARISGTTKNPQITFSSIPSLPNDEILSRIMFGKNLNNISPFQALQLADMLRTLSGSGSGKSLNPLSKLQSTLGIDELKINSDGDNDDMTVGVGKYLHENVYLEVEGGAGEDSGKVSVEVDLTPNISVETEARQNAESAVRLNYKYDY